jgi:hypothetical protein
MEDFMDVREGELDSSFHNNKEKVIGWLKSLEWPEFGEVKGERFRRVVPELIVGMLDDSPHRRPGPSVIEAKLQELDKSSHGCCFEEPETYQYAE